MTDSKFRVIVTFVGRQKSDSDDMQKEDLRRIGSIFYFPLGWVIIMWVCIFLLCKVYICYMFIMYNVFENTQE